MLIVQLALLKVLPQTLYRRTNDVEIENDEQSRGEEENGKI
jgi:hypothetical protein